MKQKSFADISIAIEIHIKFSKVNTITHSLWNLLGNHTILVHSFITIINIFFIIVINLSFMAWIRLISKNLCKNLMRNQMLINFLDVCISRLYCLTILEMIELQLWWMLYCPRFSNNWLELEYFNNVLKFKFFLVRFDISFRHNCVKNERVGRAIVVNASNFTLYV